MFDVILHATILAFGLILPLGVQNVFVFNVGVSQPSFIRTLPVIMTAAICDTILILSAVLGVSLVVSTIPWLETIIYSVGIIFLLYMGVVIWRSKPTSSEVSIQSLSTKKQIIFAASVSLLNPHAILDIIGVIGTNAMTYNGDADAKWAFTMTTIFISWIWFFGLAITGRFAKSIDHSGNLLRLINKISACIIWGVAIYMAIQLYESLNL